MKVLFVMMWILMVAGKNIHVPAVRQKQDIEVRMSNLEVVQEPEFQFQKVVRREVFESANKREKAFPPCKEEGPEVEFDEVDQMHFKNSNPSSQLVWDFQDIMYSQYVLDMAIVANQAYVMFSDAHIEVLTIGGSNQFVSSWEAKVEGVDKLSMGYFVEVGSRVLFMNGEYLLEVGEKQVVVVDGYQGGERFESLVAINDTYLAAAFQQKGIIIIDTRNMQTVVQITGEDFVPSKQIQLTDIAFVPGTNALLVLDQNHGIYAFHLNVSETLSVSKATYLYERPYCSLMYLSGQQLYVSCEEVVRISLKEWPKISQKVLAYPNIKVREIYAWGNIVAFVGNSVFKLMYMDRLVDNFEDIMMDKFVFNSRFYLSANEDGLFIGNYTIYQPYITCSTTNPKYVGEHNLVFKTKAECSDEYFQLYDIDKSTLGEIDEDDFCTYVSYRKIYFWEAGELFITPILVTFLVCVSLGFIVACLWLLKSLRLKNLRRELSDYENLEPSSAKHQQFVEEEDPKKSAASNEEQKNPNVNEQLHDIE